MQLLDRKSIQEYGIPGLILMENAGIAVARQAELMVGRRGRVCIVCGKGNNGGDGFVVARHLHNHGLRVSVFTIGPLSEIEKRPDPGTNLRPLLRMRIRIVEVLGTPQLRGLSAAMQKAGLVVDALFGTGLMREVTGLERQVIQLMNSSGRPILAIDVPSGLDVNTGIPLGIAVQAKVTVTMGLPKIGFRRRGARRYTGRIIVADISMPPELL
jgi:NAD(P)H-hydrate epimerase